MPRTGSLECCPRNARAGLLFREARQYFYAGRKPLSAAPRNINTVEKKCPALAVALKKRPFRASIDVNGVTPVLRSRLCKHGPDHADQRLQLIHCPADLDHYPPLHWMQPGLRVLFIPRSSIADHKKR